MGYHLERCTGGGLKLWFGMIGMFARLARACVVLLIAFGLVPASANGRRTTISGETVALFGTRAKALLHPIEKVSAVYGFDVSGRRVDYVEGRDFR